MPLRMAVGVGGLVLLVLAGAVSGEATDVQPVVGHRAPDFTLRDPQGEVGPTLQGAGGEGGAP